MINFFVMLGLACTLGAVAGFLLLRRRGLGLALTGALVGLLVGCLVFPFPVHGGVMFLGEVLWEELGDWVDARAEHVEERRDTGFRRAQEQRFAGDLAFVPRRRPDGVWMEALLAACRT